ncbi:MAG: hypothetical protein WC817_02950 [Patescibacteria group bacterium]|jgi:hypothetical protein
MGEREHTGDIPADWNKDAKEVSPDDWARARMGLGTPPQVEVDKVRSVSEQLKNLRDALPIAGKLEFVDRFRKKYPDAGADINPRQDITAEEVDELYMKCLTRVMDIEAQRGGSRYAYEEPLQKLREEAPVVFTEPTKAQAPESTDAAEVSSAE